MSVYANMKESGIDWIGAVPSHWATHTLYQLVSPVKSKNKDLSEKNLLSLSYGKIKRKNIDGTEGLLPESFDGYNIIEAGDVVLRLTDLQNDHTSLRVGLATERGIITSAYTTLRPSENCVSKYLYYLLHSFDIRKGFYGMGSGVRQGLNYDEVKELRIVLPRYNEQEAIAAYLDEQCALIDETIAEARVSIDEYKAWKASIIYETVTQINVKNICRENSDCGWISDIPSSWRIKPFSTEFTLGKGLPITKADLTENGIPVVSYGQIHSKSNNGAHISEDMIRYVPDGFIHSNPECLANKGDILFADTSEDYAGIGNCVLVDMEAPIFAGYHTIIARTVHPEISKYYAYLFQTDCWRKQLRANASGIKVFSVTQRMLKNVSVLIPSPDELKKIVSYLDETCPVIESMIITKQLLIEELETYKRSLIYEVVTGKRKVVQ